MCDRTQNTDVSLAGGRQQLARSSYTTTLSVHVGVQRRCTERHLHPCQDARAKDRRKHIKRHNGSTFWMEISRLYGRRWFRSSFTWRTTNLFSKQYRGIMCSFLRSSRIHIRWCRMGNRLLLLQHADCRSFTRFSL
jgi:hypothetical protein